MRYRQSCTSKRRTRIDLFPLENRDTPSVVVQFDYRYDTTGFFTDPARRASLERAAVELTTGMADDLA